MLPKELTDVLETPEFDNEAGMLIESANYVGNDLFITFSIRNTQTPPHQLWQITITGIKKEQITRNWTENLSLCDDHPMLLEFADVSTELYFNGTTADWLALYLDISQSLSYFFDGKRGMGKYGFSYASIKRLSEQGYGLFARGSKIILDIYAQCLQRAGIKPIFIGAYQPAPKNKSLKLLLFGESYFIGQEFLFERIK